MRLGISYIFNQFVNEISRKLNRIVIDICFYSEYLIFLLYNLDFLYLQ